MIIRDQFDPDLRKRIKQKKQIAIIPVGSIEQHGPHLPISTDSDIVTEISLRFSKKIDGILLPTINYGISDEHFPFFNLSIRKSSLALILEDLCSSLYDNHIDKVIILNFWATWCAPCLEEMPAFEKLYRRYRSQGLTVLAVSLDKGDSSKVENFVDKNSLTFPVLLDLDGVAEKLYPSFTIPFTYVIDKKGRVAARVDGAKNWASNETFAALDILVKG